MNSADLITSFFNNELSPDQEREFLISVASSDSMRLGLKSHVMLDRILQEENQEMMVAPATRRSILREAAAVAALAGGGATAAAAAEDSAGRPTSGTAGSGLPIWGATLLSLVLAVAGFFAGFFVGGSTDEQVMGLAGSVPVENQEIDDLTKLNSQAFAQELESFVLEPVRIVADALADESGSLATSDVSVLPLSGAGAEERVNPNQGIASSIGQSEGAEGSSDGGIVDEKSDTTASADGASGPETVTSPAASVSRPK